MMLLKISLSITFPFESIFIITEMAYLSLPSFKLQHPLDNSVGSIGITRFSIYTLVPLFIASLLSKLPSCT